MAYAVTAFFFLCKNNWELSVFFLVKHITFLRKTPHWCMIEMASSVQELVVFRSRKYVKKDLKNE